MKNIECTNCGYEIELPANTEEGELITCHDCAKEYEVLSIKPILVADAPEVEEDWGE